MKTATKSSKKKIIIISVVAALVLILVLRNASSRAAAAAQEFESYNETTVTVGDVGTYYSFTGNIESKNSDTVLANSAMQISEIHVAEGDTVQAGTLLFTTGAGGEITAKIAGTVSEIYVEQDEQVIAGSQLCAINDFTNLVVGVNISEYDLFAINQGDEIDVTINALGETVVGTVEEISNVAGVQQGVAYFDAMVSIPTNDNIKIGMSAEAKLAKDVSESTLVLPMDAIYFDDDDNSPYLLILDESGNIVEAEIETGVSDGVDVEILSGVSESQAVYYHLPEDRTEETTSRRER